MFELTSPALLGSPAVMYCTSSRAFLSERGMRQPLETPLSLSSYSVAGPTIAGMKPDPCLTETKGKVFFP